MTKHIFKQTYPGLLFGEGVKDKKFLQVLIELDKFKFYTRKWNFNTDNASGGSPETILQACSKITQGTDYKVVLCFIDLDKLKSDNPTNWKAEKTSLENKYSNFIIIWQLDNAEQEYQKVIGNQKGNKGKINRLARNKIKEFINSDLWKRILGPISNKETELA